MLPPSDSFRHQELKLAEALSTIQAIDVPPPPPPSYTLMPVADDSFHAYAPDDDEDDNESRPTRLMPITLHIDASLRIDGQYNTIVLPPTNHASSPVSAQSPTPAGPATTAQASHARGERLTSAVLIALRDADAFGGGAGEAGRAHRPLDLHINARVHVHGEKNVICAGIQRVMRKDGSAMQGKVSEAEELAEEENRKRRAESVR